MFIREEEGREARWIIRTVASYKQRHERLIRGEVDYTDMT